MARRRSAPGQLDLCLGDVPSRFDGAAGENAAASKTGQPTAPEPTPLPPAETVAGDPRVRDRLRGALLGLACGDALGAPIEFQSAESVHAHHGTVTDMIGGGIWAPGEWTDDTAMALGIAEGIIENPADPVPGAGERFLAWQSSAKDVGGTISASLAAFRRTGNWATAARSTSQARSGKAAGNGSLMRTLPVALAYADTATMLTHSARLSAMTHWDPQAEMCCAIYCLWIRELLNGAARDAGWNTALRAARQWAERGSITPGTAGPGPLPENFWPRFKNLSDLTYRDLQPSGFAGYCVECLEAAAWCALYSADAELAIIDVVNLAGESDTMGAVTGGVVGAFWGVEALPSRWLAKLHQRQRIEKLARELDELRERLRPVKKS